MSDFFNDFPSVDEKTWIEKIEKDLKGKDINETLHFNSEIEEINYKAYSHKDRAKKIVETPGDGSYLRGGSFKNNDWRNNTNISFSSAKEMNQRALDLLMKGTDSLTFELKSFTSEECETLVKGIGFDFITSTIYYETTEQHEWLSELVTRFNDFNGTFINKGDKKLSLIPKVRNVLVDGTEVQRVGGNCKQEIAYLLYKGHEALFSLLDSGVNIDDASPQIKFKIGIGSNYFFEIVKIRVFRTLWNEIVSAYKPNHKCSAVPYIEAETGNINKSLKDPYNNLLRQTTEALSAVIAGVDELTILPYNWRANKPDLSKTQRLATNIGLIIKEESYLDKVIDPSGGSYNIEDLTKEMKENAWKLFQNLEKNGVNSIKELISKTKNKRVKSIENKTNTLIGVNKYFNEDPSDEVWQTSKELTLGNELILERDCKITK